MRDRLIQSAALIVLACGLLGAFLLTPSINDQRLERQLTYSVETGDDTNPTYTALAALGSFRGVMINAMWQRSETLKQEGKFFESNNLAQQITNMQPRFPEAWNIQAWNMAYNISVKCKTQEERWDWVNKGMVLLRDRGIPNNPNAVVLYRSIAWILGHKMTGGTDDMHWYYKARMAETWQTLLGMPARGRGLKLEFQGENRPPNNELDPELHGEWLAVLDFQRVADAAESYLRKPNQPDDDYNPANYFTTLSPDTLDRFYSDNPGLRDIVDQLAALKGPNGEETSLGLNTRTLRAFGRLQMFRDAGYPPDSPAINNPKTLGIDAMAINAWLNRLLAKKTVANFRPRVDLDAERERLKQQDSDAVIVDMVPLLDLLRAQALIADYHMDPAFMLLNMQEFGPIDWRHPAAHACYWSSLGTRRAEEWSLNKDRIDLINANRAIIHSLQHLAHTGKVTFRPKVESLGELGGEVIDNAPDTRIIPAYEVAVDRVREQIAAKEFGDSHKTNTYDNGHENFLQSAVFLYYYEGNQNLAQEYFERAREAYGNREQSPVAEKGEYNLSLSDFAAVRLEDSLGFQTETAIRTWIRLAWLRGLEQRNTAVMKRYLDTAKQRYDAFLEERETVAKGDQDAKGRQNIEPFEELVLQGFLEMMRTPTRSVIQKSDIWQLAAPLLASLSQDRPLLYEAYMMLIPSVEVFINAEGWDVSPTEAFREPRGFREWYQQQINQSTQPTPLQP